MDQRSESHPRSRRCTAAWPVALTVAAVLLAAAPVAHGGLPTYELQLLGPGNPTAMNNHGEVVGFRTGAQGRGWFVDTAGTMVDLPMPAGAAQTKANDINDAGLIIGTATEPNGTPRACAWSFVDGAWAVTLLDALPVSFGSYGTAVNDLGEMVGTNIAIGSHAVLFNGPSGPVDLRDLGLTELPADINNVRQIVGEQLVLDLDDMSLVDIGVPTPPGLTYLWTAARAMNDAGQVAARCVTATGSFYPVAAKYDPAAGWQVLSAPVTGNTAHDINDHGDVLIHIQSSWGQQPYLILDGGGAARVQTLLEPGLELWFIENIGAMAMNDRLQLAVVASHFTSGEYGAVRLTPVFVPADLNEDGMVGFADLSLLLSVWGPCGDPCPADLDGDGAVSFADLTILLNAWGSA